MSTRFIATLLVAVLMWSGFAAHEQVSSSTTTNGVEQHQLPAPDGSLDAQHVDDQLVQVHLDAGAEGSALIPASTVARTPAITMARPWRYTEPGTLPPYLAGPMRPPSAKPFFA